MRPMTFTSTAPISGAQRAPRGRARVSSVRSHPTNARLSGPRRMAVLRSPSTTMASRAWGRCCLARDHSQRTRVARLL